MLRKYIYIFLLSVCLFVRVSVCLFVWLSGCLFVCLSVCLFVCLSVCMFVCLSVPWTKKAQILKVTPGYPERPVASTKLIQTNAK